MCIRDSPGEIVNLNYDMYAKPRVLSVHGVHTDSVEAENGILAGCGVAVHHLKATIKTTVGDKVEVRDYVDDMVIPAEEQSPHGAVLRLEEAMARAKEELGAVGQILNEKKGTSFHPQCGSGGSLEEDCSGLYWSGGPQGPGFGSHFEVRAQCQR